MLKPLSQLDLFSDVLHSYDTACDGVLENTHLYERVASRAGIPQEAFAEKVPVGRSGQEHNLLARAVRWHQQTLKHTGILRRIPGRRGVWGLTEQAGKDLHRAAAGVSVVAFSTHLGVAILGTCETVFAQLDAPITLCITSPPYPLAKPRGYGNPPESEYVDWVCRALEPIVKNLVRGGSICLNVSNDVFVPGSPARSLYRERLLLALHERLGLQLMDQLIWYNNAKPPGPVRWASIKRVQLCVAWEPIFWLSNFPQAVKADNRRVLLEHTERHLRLIRNGGEQRDQVFSDGAYRVHPGSFGRATPGRIPRNVLPFGHSCKDQREYKKAARAAGLPAHGAPFPMRLASFLIEFLTERDDLIVDPFGGSMTSAKAAERLGRRWLSTECMAEYVIGAAYRFADSPGFEQLIAA